VSDFQAFVQHIILTNITLFIALHCIEIACWEIDYCILHRQSIYSHIPRAALNHINSTQGPKDPIHSPHKMAISTSAPSQSLSRRKASSSKYSSDFLKDMAPPLTTDRVDRTSFSSIKESHNGGVAQTFTSSKTSSYLRNQVSLAEDEDAILDDVSVSSGSRTPEEIRKEPKQGMLTNPHSMLHGFVCPCDGFRGWKGISVRGRVASKSFGDLKGLGMRWNWESENGAGDGMHLAVEPLVKVKGRWPAGQSPLESLPMELLGEFFSFLDAEVGFMRIETGPSRWQTSLTSHDCSQNPSQFSLKM
jgi:hypothetical protein